MQVTDKDDEAVEATVPTPVVAILLEEDIPGTALGEPLEAKTMPFYTDGSRLKVSSQHRVPWIARHG